MSITEWLGFSFFLLFLFLLVWLNLAFLYWAIKAVFYGDYAEEFAESLSEVIITGLEATILGSISGTQ